MTLICGTCTACCKRDLIRLQGEDDLSAFKWHLEKEGADWVPTLDRKDNGECIYLTDDGCSIHGSQPGICKRFDCRELFKSTTPKFRAFRIAQNPTMSDVYTAGEARL